MSCKFTKNSKVIRWRPLDNLDEGKWYQSYGGGSIFRRFNKVIMRIEFELITILSIEELDSNCEVEELTDGLLHINLTYKV